MRAAVGAPTPLIRLYRALGAGLGPIAYRRIARKLQDQGVDEARAREKLGYPTKDRPNGRLIWFHGASVGESLSVLTLINRLGHQLPDAGFLITSGTATSATMVAARLPPRTQHQFAPLDIPAAVARFYDHWSPDAGIIVESELWPNMLLQGHAAGLPLALLNARLSPKSVQGWQRWPGTARQVLGVFDLMLTQNRTTADNLVAMGADPAQVRVGSNLKATSDPLPVDTRTLGSMQETFGTRPLWIASSTHPGEEQTVLAAHRRLLDQHPDLCLILAPRHPARGDEITDLITTGGFTHARRSAGTAPDKGTQVYLADTLGELGIWYALSPIVFLGGSFRPIGGHNPFEPAQSGAAVLSGPHVTNFAETYGPLVKSGGAILVEDAPDLARAVDRWMTDASSLDTARAAAKAFTAEGRRALDDIVDLLCTSLHLEAQA